MHKPLNSRLCAVAFGTAFLCMASQVQAKEKRCEFDYWQGYNDDVAISWVGIGFDVDEAKSRVRQVNQNGVSDWVSAKIAKTEKFSTFVYYIVETDSSGEKIRNRYGSRVYNRGTCEVNLSMQGYAPIIAKGKLKK